jgi:hypothetical protein
MPTAESNGSLVFEEDEAAVDEGLLSQQQKQISSSADIV